MYQTVGDAYAFRRVMDHFSILRDGVTRNHGSLVKTIGDAIMAVFSDPVHAITASVQILEAMENFNENNPETPLILKMGIHQGTCIAVTLNERLDYFGTVVNLAARLEGQSQGHDVVISQAMITDPAVMDYLKLHDVTVAQFEATLKGFSDSYALYRLTANPVSRMDTRPVTRNMAAV
jgi:class 3 adenylate cyclase